MDISIFENCQIHPRTLMTGMATALQLEAPPPAGPFVSNFGPIWRFRKARSEYLDGRIFFEHRPFLCRL